VGVGDDRLHVDIPALELVVVKRANPSDLLVRACGMEVRVPIEQGILYDLAALGLKRNAPHYK
jgi:hypothetical protein